ncbi:substrate-binding periplasmic protein [Pseudoalteromonas sp. H105]|uniref:substrate-binding periplasmic protein n=1 Tax=Pseudoalteromonas sp. H105 TaxID=1348393 RepID=UPI0007320A79|nr:transporter substrate-binding domain-containing protein [Pseudoalteromonas sp. H105]KTF13529.1 hypothetical protein ATS75_15495 [Pseudoalteromonas sp. H105]
MQLFLFSRLKLIAILIVTILAISAKAFACEKTIKISAASKWPPFSYTENGIQKGLDIEIIELVLSKAGICWEYIVYPSSSRALNELKHGRVDLIFAASFTEERSDYAIFSLAYRIEQMQLFENTNNAKTWGKSKNIVFAVNRGSYYGALFKKYVSDCYACVVETNHLNERINLVKKKRVDFAIEEYLAGSYFIIKNGMSDFVRPTNIMINSNPVYYMLNTQRFSKREVNILNDAIKNSDAEIAELIEKYQRELTF